MDIQRISGIDRENLWAVANVVTWGTNGKAQPGDVHLTAIPSSIGIILSSTDGGQSWEIQRVERGQFLCGVHFVDRLTGWVSSDSDLILKTMNGGKSWIMQKAPAKSLWCDVQFINSSQGWILGADGKVLRTEDGGGEWKLSQIAGKNQPFSLSFLDENTGWVVGENGIAYESIDAGAHWRARGHELRALLMNPAESAIDFRVVKFVDSNVGFIAADALSKHGEFDAKAVLFKTVDGGRTWTTTIIPDLLGLRSAEFLSNAEAWIVPGGRGRTYISQTKDGGENWSPIQLPPNGEPGQLLFVDTNHGWFLNRSDTFSSDRIFRTNDGGKTWVGINITERIVPH